MNNLIIVISSIIEIIEQNFQSERGDSFDLSLTFKDENGGAVDITAWKIFFTAKLSKDLDDDDEGVIAKTADIIKGDEGTAKISLTAEDTDDLLGVYFYDVQYKDKDDNVKTIIKGKIIFTKDITRKIE